jgi:hypothetical protein
MEWAGEDRDELMEDWNLCSQLKAPKAARMADEDSPENHRRI